MADTLYERLGRAEGIQRIADDLIDNHFANPQFGPRFARLDRERLKEVAAKFFVSGSGGPNVYEGKDMVSVHRGMNVNNDEFMAVLDDAVMALEKNDVGQREKEEVLFIFFSMKGEVVGQ